MNGAGGELHTSLAVCIQDLAGRLRAPGAHPPVRADLVAMHRACVKCAKFSVTVKRMGREKTEAERLVVQHTTVDLILFERIGLVNYDSV